MKSLHNHLYDQHTSNSFQPFKKKRNYEEGITQKADSSDRKGIEIYELVNTIPKWAVEIGMLKPWCFAQDLFNFKNPFK